MSGEFTQPTRLRWSSVTTLKWLASASLAVILFPAVPPTALRAEAHCPGNVVSIRPRFVGHAFILVPVMLNNSGPYEFVVDTGAQLTMIDRELAAEVHPERLGATHVTGVGIYADAEYGQLEVLQAGTYSTTKPLVLIQDLGWVRKIDRNIRGVLGENFLEHFDLLIDYSHRILCLDDTKQMQRQVRGIRVALASPPFPERNLPFREPLIVPVNVRDVADQPLLLELDSGIDVPVLFKSGVQSPALSFIGTSQSHRNAGEIRQAFAVLPRWDIQIGSHTLHQITFMTPVAVDKDVPVKPEVDGVLPTSLFRSAFVSYADHFAVLEP